MKYLVLIVFTSWFFCSNERNVYNVERLIKELSKDYINDVNDILLLDCRGFSPAFDESKMPCNVFLDSCGANVNRDITIILEIVEGEQNVEYCSFRVFYDKACDSGNKRYGDVAYRIDEQKFDLRTLYIATSNE
ncbi:MAG: hypothetical protein MK081_12345 [Flavobacteriales bacterium]|nr:hypothetical protein [Flavobacteriales bacterium]